MSLMRICFKILFQDSISSSVEQTSQYTPFCLSQHHRLKEMLSTFLKLDKLPLAFRLIDINLRFYGTIDVVFFVLALVILTKGCLLHVRLFHQMPKNKHTRFKTLHICKGLLVRPSDTHIYCSCCIRTKNCFQICKRDQLR